MKTITLAIMLLILVPTTALSRIGETEKTFNARYGQPVKILNNSRDRKIVVYNTQQYRIRVKFRANAAVTVSYSLRSGGAISTQRIEHLLHKNGAGTKSMNFWYINGITRKGTGVTFVDRNDNNRAIYDFTKNRLTITSANQ